jgi:uncharacterized membrane protein YfcA
MPGRHGLSARLGQVSVGTGAVLVGAGALAGVLGTAGGITSLVSYPALLAVGVPRLPANVVNLVALVACWPGSALASRRELAGTRPFLRRGLAVAAAGAGLGALLLLTTPAGVFARLVPVLVALGSLALLLQPRLTAAAARRRAPSADERSEERSDEQMRAGAEALTLVAVGLLSVYSGYFGAGSGVLLLVVAMVVLDPDLPRANAIKNMLVGASALASAVVFVVAGPVDWDAVAPLAFGLFTGSLLGPVLARRLPARHVRHAVSALGLLLAVSLWLQPG